MEKKILFNTTRRKKKRTLFGPPWLDIIIDDSPASLYIIIKPAARNMGVELNGDLTFERHIKKKKAIKPFFFFCLEPSQEIDQCLRLWNKSPWMKRLQHSVPSFYTPPLKHGHTDQLWWFDVMFSTTGSDAGNDVDTTINVLRARSNYVLHYLFFTVNPDLIRV